MVAELGIIPKDASEVVDDIMDWRPCRRLAKELDDNIIRDFIEEQLIQRDDEMIVDYSDELRRRQALLKNKHEENCIKAKGTTHINKNHY